MSNTTSLDLTAHRESTQALVDSMDATTELFHDMADNMSQMSESFEGFGESN